MTLRKDGRSAKNPRKNKPTISPKITDKSAVSKRTSAAAKKNNFGGKVVLTEEQAERKAANKKKKQFKPSEEAEIRALWESGEYTLGELAERYSRNRDSLSRYFSQRGIIKGAKAEEFAIAVNKRIMDELMGDAGETVKKVKALKSDYLAKIDVAKKIANNEIAATQRKGLPLSAALPSLRTIKEYIGILTVCRSEEYDLLGVIEFEARVEHDDLPELIVTELTVGDIEDMRRKQKEAGSLEEAEIETPEGDDDDDDTNEVVDES